VATIDVGSGSNYKTHTFPSIFQVYKNGAVLNPHCDRIPLISSAIINVAQEVDEPWPLEVYDRYGNAVNVTMNPGDMVLYESHSLIHGRPFELKGQFMANVFVHFEPYDVDRDRVVSGDGSTQDGKGGDLPPYVLPDSPEADFWREDNPHGWSRYFSENEETPKSNVYASEGRLDELKQMAELDPKLLHFGDPYGWTPVSKNLSVTAFVYL